MTAKENKIMIGVMISMAIIAIIIYIRRRREQKFDDMIPKTYAELALIHKVPGDKAGFGYKVLKMADELNVNPNHLMAIMDFESGGTFRADKWGGYNGKYVGLIQFGASAAQDLGTTQSFLESLTNVEQLDFVLKYFKMWNRRIFPAKIASFADLYLAVLYPGAIKVQDNSFDLGSIYSGLRYPNQAHNLYNSYGQISKDSITNAYKQRYPFLTI